MRAKVGAAAVAVLMLSLAGTAKAACDPSNGATYVCGPINPEDMVRIPGTDWIVTGGQASPANPQNNLYLVDTRARTSKILYPGTDPQQRPDTTTYKDCPGRVDPAKFSAHGVALRPGKNGLHTLYTVNHAGRESEEIFEIDVRGKEPKIVWTGCVVAPPNWVGNGVAPLPDGGLVATNFSRPGEFAKIDKGEDTGNLMTWHPGTGWTDIPGSESSAPNGVEVSKDGKWLYIPAWGSREIIRLSLGRTPMQRDVIHTSFLPDNIRWSGSDLYVVGQDGTPSKVLDCVRSPATVCTDRYVVLKIDPKTWTAKEILHPPANSVFGGGTTAIRIGNELWVSSTRADRVAIFQMPK